MHQPEPVLQLKFQSEIKTHLQGYMYMLKNKLDFCLKDTDRSLGKTLFLSISNRQHVINHSVKNDDNTKYKNR